ARIPGIFGAAGRSLRIAARPDGTLLLWSACALEDGGVCAPSGAPRAQAGRLADAGLEGPYDLLPGTLLSEQALDVVAFGAGALAFLTDLSGSDETRVLGVPLDASGRPAGTSVVVWHGARAVSALAAEPLGAAAILLVASSDAAGLRTDVVRIEGAPPQAHPPIALPDTDVAAPRGWLAPDGLTA